MAETFEKTNRAWSYGTLGGPGWLTAALMTGLIAFSLTLLSCCSWGVDWDTDPGGRTDVLGIKVDGLTVRKNQEECYAVRLDYRIRPLHRGSSFDVTYAWDADRYQVTGLDDRTVDRQGDEYPVWEDFDVCPRHHVDAVFHLPIEIRAASDRHLYFTHETAYHVLGMEDRNPKLASLIDAYEAAVDDNPTPATLRGYWKTIYAYNLNGYHHIPEDIARRLSRELSDFQVDPAREVVAAYRRLLERDSGNVAVSFSRSTGRPRTVYLNRAYQVDGSPESVARLIGTPELGAVLGMTPEDQLQHLRTDDGPAGKQVIFIRQRDGVPVYPDMISVGLGTYRSTRTVRSGLYVHSVFIDFGDLDGVSCAGASDAVPDRMAPPVGEAFTDVVASLRIQRIDDAYACVYKYRARTQDPDDPSLTVPYHKIVDARTGAVYRERILEDETGSAYDRHTLWTTLSVPYQTPWPGGTFSDRPTTLPRAVIQGFHPPELTDKSSAFSDRLGTFLPIDITASGPQGPDHTNYGYRPYFSGPDLPSTRSICLRHSGTAPVWGDIPENMYESYMWDRIPAGDLAGHVPGITLPPHVIEYDLDWPAATDDTGERLRSEVVAAHMYMWAHYAQRVLMETGGNGDALWSPGPYRSCGGWGNLYLWFTRSGAHNSSDSQINFNISSCGKNCTTNIMLHEFGHWISEATDDEYETTFASGGAMVEAFADHTAMMLSANYFDIGHRDRLTHLPNPHWQFESQDDLRWFRGNTLYPTLAHDHSYESRYDNAGNWSTMYTQYMNTVGGYWSYRTVHAANHQQATDTHGCGEKRDGTNTNPYATAARLSKLMGQYDLAHDDTEADFDGQFVASHAVELQNAFKQHGWHHDLNDGSVDKVTHKVSMSPSHAYALTPNDTGETRVHVRFDPGFHTKHVNFYASAGVKYTLRVLANTSTEIDLYAVRGYTPYAFLHRIARNSECSQPTDAIGPQIGHVFVFPANDPAVCDPGQPAIQFMVSKSGWYGAAIEARLPNPGTGQIVLRAENGITSNTAHAKVDFVESAERLMGQSVPISTAGVRVARQGTFRMAGEQQFWRFQVIPSQRYRDQAHGARSEVIPEAAFGPANGFRYTVRVRRDDDGSDLELDLWAQDPNGGPPVDLNPSVHYSSQVLANRRIDGWTVRMNDVSGAIGYFPRGTTVYAALRWIGNVAVPPVFTEMHTFHHQYEISAIASNGDDDAARYEPDTTVSNPFQVQRWCADTYGTEPAAIERSSNNYTLNERLSHDDADYFEIYLQQGEHLNVTYRGDIPAALDIDGPRAVQVAGQTVARASPLNYFAHGSQSALSVEPTPSMGSTYIQEWRPTLPLANTTWIPTSYINYDESGGVREYYAERGYLWQYNVLPEPECQTYCWPTPAPDACLPYCDVNEVLPITGDNAVHLTLTAFVSGPYTIRVRGQKESTLALQGRYNDYDTHIVRYHQGVPYTLNLNLGVNKNPRRPHWQHLQPDNDADRQLAATQACWR
ncbi:MAG: hypothetical protein GY719_12705 [bacterium]|nr:hypothetical protein [bacterium]